MKSDHVSRKRPAGPVDVEVVAHILRAGPPVCRAERAHKAGFAPRPFFDAPGLLSHFL